MRALAALAVALVAGCAGPDPYRHAPIADHLRRDDAVGACARLFARIDAAVDAAGRRDAQAPRIDGFPYLRVDRLTAHVKPAAADRAAQQAWRERLAQLDHEARIFELADGGAAAADASALSRCRDRLLEEDSGAAQRLAAAAIVPDDYSTALRALGLYPLTKLAFAAGIRAWHAEVRAQYALPLERLPLRGALTRYAPRPPLVLARAEPRIDGVDALGLPRLGAAETEALFARHAPLLEVDTVDSDDRIGRLAWGDGGTRVVVDTSQPAAYARLTFTRFGGRLLPQLVYTFWFPARPPQASFDVLAGHLDGLIWRVTLDADLRPLVYDTIHPCGCYHLFFPTERVRARPQPIAGEGAFDETMFAPQLAPTLRDGERVLLRLSARSHYLQRVVAAQTPPAGAIEYALRDDNELRALPWPNESAPQALRSAFDPDGLIAGSERLERFFFWPMGIASAGQMRQWGRHATAFVGRRHFDDPLLFERYFELSAAGDGRAAPVGGRPVGDD
jgi:hypothetical protein